REGTRLAERHGARGEEEVDEAEDVLHGDDAVAVRVAGDAAAREDPRPAGTQAVGRPAGEGGGAVLRERDRVALLGAAHGSGPDELPSLLRPDAGGARKNPARADFIFVFRRAVVE